MSPTKCELRIDIVIEPPMTPAIRIVTGRALLSERTLVNVIGRVTGNTAEILLPIHMIDVTRLTSRNRVEPEQRKFGQLMVEQYST